MAGDIQTEAGDATRDADAVASSLDLLLAMLERRNDDPSPLIVRAAAQALKASTAALSFVDDTGRITLRASFGMVGRVPDDVVSRGGSLAERVAHFGKPIFVADYETEIGVPTYAAAPVQSAIGVPVVIDGQIAAVLTVGRSTDVPALTEADIEQLTALAQHVAVFFGHTRARRREVNEEVIASFDLIIALLQTDVVHELFATSIALQSVAATIPDPEVRRRLLGSVQGIDASIEHIRNAIFQLDAALRPDSTAFGDAGMRRR